VWHPLSSNWPNGEEILIINRDRPIAKIVEVRPSTDEEQQLVMQGKMKLPEKQITEKFIDKFLGRKASSIGSGSSSVHALLKDRVDD